MKSLSILFLYTYGVVALYAQEACTNVSDGTVRLQGFPTSLAGRVEICQNGVWGTVCGDSAFTPWSEKNAQVVCRVLGYSGALNSILHERLPLEVRVPEDTPIHINGVQCLGHEDSLDECRSLDYPSCTHVQDVAITCRPNGGFGANGEIGDVRLIGNCSNGCGAVQIRDFRLGFIGICPDDGTFDTVEANIVCRQLGYDSGSVMEFRDEFGSFFVDTKAQGFNCGPEESFSTSPTCSYDLTSTCASSSLVGVACTRSDLPDSSIRLSGGTNSRQGMVEILINGRWGRICGTSWDDVDGQVACRELEFGIDRVGTSGVSAAESPNRLQPIWLGGLECSATSGNLNRCLHLEPTGYADCYNPDSTLAYLECEPGPKMLSGGAIFGIVVGVIAAILFILCMIYMEKLKEVWNRRESYTAYRCVVCPYRACKRYVDDCYEGNQSPSPNPNPRTTEDTAVVFSLNRVPAATDSNETATNTNTRRSSTSSSEPEPEPEPEPEREPERDERERRALTKPDPLSYQAASDLPAINPSDLPPPYPGPPNAAGMYLPSGAAYPPVGDLAYPPATVPGAGLQGYPPPTHAGLDYPPTLEPAATTGHQHAPLDPVLAEELAHVPQETLPGSLLGELP